MPIPGSNIRLLRQQQGLSLRAFAEAVGFDVAGLSRLESGKGGYTRPTLERIAKVLNVSIGVLFADPGVVEAAALRMRQIPVLSHHQLLLWRGPDEDYGDIEPEYLHGAIDRMSRHCFAVRLTRRDVVAPFDVGDELIFDAKVSPKPGATVVAQSGAGEVFIGRLRLHSSPGHDTPQFEIMPHGALEPSTTSATDPTVRIRGTLVESRHFWRPSA